MSLLLIIPKMPHIKLTDYFKNLLLAFLIIFCFALAIEKSFLFKSSEIVLPAATNALLPISRGAISEQLDPTKTLLPIFVLYFFFHHSYK